MESELCDNSRQVLEGLQAELAGAAAAAQETVKKVHESALAALNRDPDAWCMHVVAT